MFMPRSASLLEILTGLKSVEMVMPLLVFFVLVYKLLFVVVIERTGSFYDSFPTFFLYFLYCNFLFKSVVSMFNLFFITFTSFWDNSNPYIPNEKEKKNHFKTVVARTKREIKCLLFFFFFFKIKYLRI
jgi:hypothetical protein